MRLDGREIVLGVTGSIAAYKAVVLLRELTALGAGVTVCLSEHARHFVGPLTFRTLSGRPVLTDLFDPQSPEAVEHVALAERAAVVVVAPATAHLLAKAAHGLADDFLTTLLLAARCPILMAPAMDGGMWEHPAVVANVATLRGRGMTVMEPEVGPLASGLSGRGRLPEIPAIVEALYALLAPAHDLGGDTIVITAGPTREPIDPVRYISNRSSGKQGHAVADEAAARGAAVTLVTTVDRPAPRGAEVVRVDTAAEMAEAVLAAAGAADVVVMAAAVADFRPVQAADQKVKKADGPPELVLEPTTDILAGLGARKRPGQVLVGFAAETTDVRANAADKLERKGADLVVANDVSAPGAGFEHETNSVIIVRHGRPDIEVSLRDKRAVAGAILDAVVDLRSAAPPATTEPTEPTGPTQPQEPT
jgi:phosphopantothenoylcysteine decarboxylase/phosphopantothenate--cysteine ligase